MAGVWVDEVQTCWGEEVMLGDGGVVECGMVVWVEQVACGGHCAGRLGSSDQQGVVGGRGGQLKGAGRGAGGC